MSTANVPVRAASSFSGLLASTVKYVLRTEVHTFAFSLAANAILSFFSFVLLLTLIRCIFRSRTIYDVVVQPLRDYLPAAGSLANHVGGGGAS